MNVESCNHLILNKWIVRNENLFFYAPGHLSFYYVYYVLICNWDVRSFVKFMQWFILHILLFTRPSSFHSLLLIHYRNDFFYKFLYHCLMLKSMKIFTIAVVRSKSINIHIFNHFHGTHINFGIFQDRLRLSFLLYDFCWCNVTFCAVIILIFIRFPTTWRWETNFTNSKRKEASMKKSKQRTVTGFNLIN